MITLGKDKSTIFQIKETLKQTPCPFYTHHYIKKNEINDSTFSIVMTASNRPNQTYFTLQSIMRSANKNVHVIIVDDSDNDPIHIEQLETYPFSIDFIQINRSQKTWINPCLNYNIGFQFIKGGYVIIQNAEVCHIGDVLSYLDQLQLKDDKYYIADVKASKDFETNNSIYQSEQSVDIYGKENLFHIWYHSASRSMKYHFLSACNRATFNKIGGFSYDYSLGHSYDDDDFLIKIASKNIEIICFHHTESLCGGIHLFHTAIYLADRFESNQTLFESKRKYFNNHRVYIEISENSDTFDESYEKIKTA